MRGIPIAVLALLACAAHRDAGAEARFDRAAGPADVAYVLGRLGSRELSEVAWGAHVAADLRVTEAAPLVVARLREQAALPAAERSFPVCAALLDALVVLDPDVEAVGTADLLPHAQGLLLPAVIVLLARRPKRRADGCLPLFETLPAGERAWRALGNALAVARTPGFAAALLRGLELRIVVRVWTDLPPGGYREPGGSVPGCGFARARPEGFPPPVVYRLRDECTDGAPMLADGPRPVYYGRYEYEDGRIWTCSSLERGVPPHAARLEWLAAWGARPADLVERVEMDHRWTGVKPYVRDVSRRRDAVVTAWRSAVRTLASSGLLSASDRLPSTPPVVVEPQDRRVTWWTPPLPPLPPPRLPKRWLRLPRSGS